MPTVEEIRTLSRPGSTGRPLSLAGARFSSSSTMEGATVDALAFKSVRPSSTRPRCCTAASGCLSPAWHRPPAPAVRTVAAPDLSHLSTTQLRPTPHPPRSVAVRVHQCSLGSCICFRPESRWRPSHIQPSPRTVVSTPNPRTLGPFPTNTRRGDFRIIPRFQIQDVKTDGLASQWPSQRPPVQAFSANRGEVKRACPEVVKSAKSKPPDRSTGSFHCHSSEPRAVSHRVRICSVTTSGFNRRRAEARSGVVPGQSHGACLVASHGRATWSAAMVEMRGGRGSR